MVLFIGVFYLVISLLQTSQDLVKIIEPLEEGDLEFELEHCGCLRRLKNITENPHGTISFNQTTCSLDAYRRGPNQKIIGFSFYGDINSDYR